MRVKLFDLIGIKSGMNFYLEAFYKLLKENNIHAEVISNFNLESKKAHLPNIFIKPTVKKVVNLFVCYLRLLKTVFTLKEDEYIVVLLYGLEIEIPMLLIARLSKRVILDAHEIIALDNKSSFYKKILSFLFKGCPNIIISHSARTNSMLAEFSYNNQVLSVPHFHYTINVDYDSSKIGEDISAVFQNKCKNFLFFGNIRPSKGIFDLLAASGLVEKENVKIIIAGQDIFNNIRDYKSRSSIKNNVQLVLRHVNDNEMKYLFAKSDFILLPYENISQSGVVEMAITFRKPLLTSNITYFKEIIDSYPSFGKYINTKDAVVFSKNICLLADKTAEDTCYLTQHVEKYYQNQTFKTFVDDLKSYNDFLKRAIGHKKFSLDIRNI